MQTQSQDLMFYSGEIYRCSYNFVRVNNARATSVSALLSHLESVYGPEVGGPDIREVYVLIFMLGITPQIELLSPDPGFKWIEDSGLAVSNGASMNIGDVYYAAHSFVRTRAEAGLHETISLSDLFDHMDRQFGPNFNTAHRVASETMLDLLIQDPRITVHRCGRGSSLRWSGFRSTAA